MMITRKELAKSIKQLNWTKRFAILICILFFSGIVLNILTEGFRLNQNLRWIYQYGQVLSSILFYGALLGFLLNAIHIAGAENN